jgi:hypothetical protein
MLLLVQGDEKNMGVIDNQRGFEMNDFTVINTVIDEVTSQHYKQRIAELEGLLISYGAEANRMKRIAELEQQIEGINSNSQDMFDRLTAENESLKGVK